MSRVALQDSTDESISSNSAPVARGGSASVTDSGGKYMAIIAALVAIGALVVAIQAEERAATARDIGEARYSDLVARHAATSEDARVAERDATVAVERSHDLMERVSKLEVRAGILTTERH